MKIGSIGRLVWAGATGLLFGAAAANADVSYSLEAGMGYSDNIERVPTNEQDEKIGTVAVDLAWTERTRRLTADADVDLSYFEYLDNTFESEVVGTADGLFTVGIVPERFTWLFQDSFGQAQTDPFTPITPDNRENLNYFTTGPDVIVRLGSAGALRLFGRYADTDYERSPLDAERTSAGLALARQPSQRSELAINAISEQIDFADETNPDYDRDSAFISYRLDGSRTDINTELGYTWLEPADGAKTGGLLANLSVIRDLSAASTLQLDLGTQFTDASDALRSAIEGGAVGGPDVTATADPFEGRFVSLRWAFSRNRTGLTLGASWNEDRYEQQTQLDRTRVAYEAIFTRRMASSLDLMLMAVLNDEEFDTTGLTSDELNVVARLNWRIGRALGLALSVERSDRDSSTGLGEYVENRAFLTLTYKPPSNSSSAPPSTRAIP